jgi:hypothetical protein
MMLLEGIALGIFIGLVLGTIGAGGAILAVPGLIAVMGLSTIAATTSSLVIVGSAAVAGFIPRLKTKTVDVRFVLDNKDLKLVPSMFGKVDINIKKDVMLTLPKTAVLKKANDYYVFKPLANGEFKPAKIEAKRVSSNKYEILSGLEQNDEVINNALFLLDSDATTNALYKSDDENW